MKRALIGIAIAITALAILISRTTEDYDEARAKMSPAEIQYLDGTLMRIREATTREDLKVLLGEPYSDLSFGMEWKGPSFWSRVRVYFSDDGSELTRVGFRRIGSFDIRFRPWLRPEPP